MPRIRTLPTPPNEREGVIEVFSDVTREGEHRVHIAFHEPDYYDREIISTLDVQAAYRLARQVHDTAIRTGQRMETDAERLARERAASEARRAREREAMRVTLSDVPTEISPGAYNFQFRTSSDAYIRPSNSQVDWSSLRNAMEQMSATISTTVVPQLSEAPEVSSTEGN